MMLNTGNRKQGDVFAAGRRQRLILIKRVFDIVLVGITAPITIPLMTVAALAVRVVDGKPIIYRQTRLGIDEAEFKICKFRTMRVAAPTAPDHGRVTRLGSCLRKLSIDELPQLYNVLRGDMSLVGPRPLFPRYKFFYTEAERLRHSVRPGITGLAQTSGRNSLRWSSRLALDVEYVQNLSLSQDIKILWRTVAKIRGKHDISVVARDTGEPLDIERSYPCLEGYSIRRFNALDIGTRVAWMTSPKTSEYMNIPNDLSRESTLAWYESIKLDPWRDDFVVYNQSTEEVVAMLGLRSQPNANTGTLYIFSDPDKHGRGYGKLSATLLLVWAKKSRYDSIILSVDKRNVAGVRLYEGLGFLLTSDEAERREYAMDVGYAA